MKTIDIRFDKKTLDLLKSLIGKQMDEFSCRRLGYTTSVYGMAIIQIEGELYRLTNQHEVMDYMNQTDAVGVFRFEPSDADEIERLQDGGILTHTPIRQRIAEIQIMNENQQLFHNGIQTYDVNTVRGIVFVMEDGREVSFEKEVWFSEMIRIKTGHSLMEEYEPMDDFLNNWEEFPEYEPRGTRNVMKLK